MTGQEFLMSLADQLAKDLTANGQIRRFTRHPALTGAYAEATVRRLVRQIVFPLHVSHGAVIWEDGCPDPPELDTIIWFPCPVPAIFEVGDFALVPRGSAVAYLEIKRSNYDAKVGQSISRKLAQQDDLVPLFPGEPQLPIKFTIGAPPIPAPRALGVVCLREHDVVDTELDQLVEASKAVVLLEKRSDDLIANPDGVYGLVNFLLSVRLRARFRDGLSYVNWLPFDRQAVGQTAPDSGAPIEMGPPSTAILGSIPNLARHL